LGASIVTLLIASNPRVIFTPPSVADIHATRSPRSSGRRRRTPHGQWGPDFPGTRTAPGAYL